MIASGSRRLSCLLAALLLAGCSLLERRQPLLLVVTVDTLRADHLGVYGNALGLTPRLDRLARESVVFDAAYAPTSFTLPSLSALMTSRYPEEVGIAGNSTVLAKDAATLAAWLKARGYRTGAVVSNFVLRRQSGFDAGFDTYDATFPQREAVRPVPERVGPETTAAALRALDELAKERRPAFLWVHYQDPHGPYSPPEGRRARHLEGALAAPDGRRELPVSKTQSGMGAIPRYQYLQDRRDPAFYRAGYSAEVAYVDEAIGALLDGVAARGLLRDATIVFAADHGEALGENDYWFSHGELLTDPLVRVPLFVRAKGRAAGRRTEVVSLLDVFPTLAALAAGASPAGLRGRNLLAPGASSHPSALYMTTLSVAPVPRFGLIARGYKYLVSMETDGPREQLFRAGDESHELADTETKALASLRAELAAARNSLRRSGASEQALTPEERESLKALGYVEGR